MASCLQARGKVKPNLLRECLLKNADHRKTLNMHQFPYLVWGRGTLCVARPGLCLPSHLPYLPVGSLGSGWSGSTVHSQSQERCKYGGCWLTLSGLLLLPEILDGHYTMVGQGNCIKAFPWPGSLCRLPGTAQESG